MSTLDRYNITWAVTDLARLGSLWQALEVQAAPNFFLSWAWVSTWLRVFKPDCRVLQVHDSSGLVGLGLITLRREVRHGVISSRVLRLGQTGLQDEDQIWIEYNDLLLLPAHSTLVPQAVMSWLCQQADWDELQLGAMMAERQQCYHNPGCHPVMKWSAPVYGVNLAALRQHGQVYLSSLSRNTRHQIVRSERLYEEAGELQFSVVSGSDEMLSWWPVLSGLHRQRWDGVSGGSGFANPHFVTFHQSLIRQVADAGLVEFCILTHAGNTIGILYNFVYRGRVYFYLSGLAYGDDSRLKPGLVIHARAIQHYLAGGHGYYDFMGGEARYKQSMGECAGELQLISYQRPRIGLRLEQWARRAKQCVASNRQRER